jgi:hypothetical protein
MAVIRIDQNRSIHAIGRELSIFDPSMGRDDNLHALILRLTGKKSIKMLTELQAQKVIVELMQLMRYDNRADLVGKKSCSALTAEQQNKIWALMYELKKYDKDTLQATVGERLCGVIKKLTGKENQPKEPFKDLTASEARRITEEIKRYIASAKRNFT